MSRKNNYKRTIKQAAGLAETEHATLQRREHERDLDRAIAYETTALASSMGMLGMEDENSELLQLEMAQEIMFKINEETDKKDHGKFD